MEGYVSEDEQLEVLRRWWRKNGKSIILGLLIAAIGVGVWRGYEAWHAKREEQAASLYSNVIQAEQKSNTSGIIQASKATIAAYPNTIYAAMAGLALGKAELGQNHTHKAEQAFAEVAKHSPDRGVALIARLRWAKVQLMQSKPRAALETLQAADAGPFAAQYAISEGDAELAMKHVQAAREDYENAMHQMGPGGAGLGHIIQMRLATLPPAASHGAPSSATKAPASPSHKSTTQSL